MSACCFPWCCLSSTSQTGRDIQRAKVSYDKAVAVKRAQGKALERDIGRARASYGKAQADKRAQKGALAREIERAKASYDKAVAIKRAQNNDLERDIGWAKASYEKAQLDKRAQIEARDRDLARDAERAKTSYGRALADKKAQIEARDRDLARDAERAKASYEKALADKQRQQQRQQAQQTQVLPVQVPPGPPPRPYESGDTQLARSPSSQQGDMDLSEIMAILPTVVRDTFVPVPWEWIESVLHLGPPDEELPALPPPRATSPRELPRCWSLQRPEEVLHEDYWPRGRSDRLVQHFDDPEWSLPGHLRQMMNASRIVVPPWSPLDCEPSARTKVVTFQMPLPTDIPRSVTQLISLPEFISVQACYYYRRLPPRGPGQVAPIALFWESRSEGAPFCDKYCIHGTMQFSFGTGGRGIHVVAWSQVHWIAELGWGLDLLKSVLEMMVRREATSHLPHLASCIGRDSGCTN